MPTKLKHLVVLDFEATCDGETPPDPQEIIEFPSVLLRADSMEVVDEFEAFVRPTRHPKLSAFCTELTSIVQDDVATASPFPVVFDAHMAWMLGHGLDVEGGADFALVTCGDWDLQTMLPAQLRACEPAIEFVPAAYRRWINVKRPYAKWAQTVGKRPQGGMKKMLEVLGLDLEGRHHRGIDDCRNIARIVRTLHLRHQTLEPTAALAPSRYPPLAVVLVRDGRERPLLLTKRSRLTLLGLASSEFRKQARRAFVGDREVRSDEDLFDLRSGAHIRVE